MHASTSPAAAPITYADVAPLDWFHLRALLWEGWSLSTRSTTTADWQRVAALVNARAGDSPPVSGEACRDAFQSVTAHLPNAPAGAPDGGYQLWNNILYRRAQRLFGRPVFMNLGYVDDQPGPSLDPCDEPYRLFIQLYARALHGTLLAGRDVLEVGCGGGGGCDYLTRYHAPASVTGLDLEEENLTTCRLLQTARQIRFIRGTADALPFPPGSFDLVINIESSGGYARLQEFFSEVARVLRPGGRFVFADLRPVEEEWGDGRTAAALDGQIRRGGLRPIAADDITRNVLASIALQDEGRRAALESLGLEPHERRHFEEIMLCRGSRNGDRLLRGRLQYWRFVCERGD